MSLLSYILTYSSNWAQVIWATHRGLSGNQSVCPSGTQRLHCSDTEPLPTTHHLWSLQSRQCGICCSVSNSRNDHYHLRTLWEKWQTSSATDTAEITVHIWPAVLSSVRLDTHTLAAFEDNIAVLVAKLLQVLYRCIAERHCSLTQQPANFSLL